MNSEIYSWNYRVQPNSSPACSRGRSGPGNKKTPLRGQVRVKAASFEPCFSRVRVLYTHIVIRQSTEFISDFAAAGDAVITPGELLSRWDLGSEVTQEKGDQQGIDDVDEEGADQRYDDEGEM
jgi:hypothetical protein